MPNDLYDIFSMLLGEYGPRHWWPARTPFEMMTGAILTQNTSWSNVERAIAGFGDRLSPQFILDCGDAELVDIIRPSGYYNQKAKRLKTLARWYAGYGFDIERVRSCDGEHLRAELLALDGVGHETAYSMLLYAFDKPYFVVDTYTRRLLSHLGWALPRDYDTLRLMIEGAIARELYLYNEFHALIVEHAKVRCSSRGKPLCTDCPLSACCTDPC
ncbi:MAG: endonuclease III domain-containing protein [Acetanaerobacterium sp.]